MKKGLTLTLMTVAIALVSVQAHALAPVISDIPSPIVGVTGAVSNPNMFVYQDAFDLNTLASDDGTPADQLMWSYEIPTTPKYRINGVMPWNSTDGLPTSPTAALAAKIINRNVAGGELNADGKANTITIRNINLWPLGATTTTLPAPGFYDNQAVTFYVSDGLALSSQTVFFYTDLGGANRLSPKPQPPFGLVKDDPFAANMTPWTVFDTFGTIKFTDRWSDGAGVCITVPAAGNNFGSIASPMPYFNLAQNQVYRIRARMNCTQAAPGHTPFWDIVLENYDGAPTNAKGYNLYAYDAMFFDNEGGANAVITTSGGTWYTMYWTPAAVATPQWNDATTGLFIAGYQANRDPRIRFRVLDVDSATAFQAWNKSGTLCMQELLIESIPLSKVKAVASVANLTELYGNDPKSATVTPTEPKTNIQVVGPLINSVTTGGGFIGTNVVFWKDTTAGNPQYMRLTPTGAGGPALTDGSKAELIEITPATDNQFVFGTWATFGDNYPITWKSNKIYRFQVTLQAPSTASAAHPYDVMWMNMEAATNEVIGESMLSSNKGIGSPKAAPALPQTYTFFQYSGNETKSSTAAMHSLRWRLRFGNSPGLLFPNGDANNAGSVDVRGIKVDEIVFTP